MCPETPEHGVTRVDGMRMIAQSAGRAQIEGRSTAMVLTLDGECAAAAAAALADSLRTCAPVARAAKPRRSRHNCDAAVGCRRPRPTQCLVRGRLRLRRAAPKGTPPRTMCLPPAVPLPAQRFARPRGTRCPGAARRRKASARPPVLHPRAPPTSARQASRRQRCACAWRAGGCRGTRLDVRAGLPVRAAAALRASRAQAACSLPP